MTVKVRCTWLKLYCLNSSSVRINGDQAHTTVHVSRQGMDGHGCGDHTRNHAPVSFPEQPQINGGNERTENLHASHLCLSGNMGLPKQGEKMKEVTLHGN